MTTDTEQAYRRGVHQALAWTREHLTGLHARADIDAFLALAESEAEHLRRNEPHAGGYCLLDTIADRVAFIRQSVADHDRAMLAEAVAEQEWGDDDLRRERALMDHMGI